MPLRLGVLDNSGLLRFADAATTCPTSKTANGIEEMRGARHAARPHAGDAYEEKEMTLAPGDRVLLHSDGIAEAHDLTGRCSASRASPRRWPTRSR